MKASARQRPPKRVPHLRSPVAESSSCDDNSQPCGGQQPFFCSEEQKGEEAASLGNQSRKRVSGCFPPAIHSRESPVTVGSAAIIRPSQELSRFAAHTFRQIVSRRNTKSVLHCEEAVDAETSLWKPEEI
jgi:hypothetical protein